MKLIILIGILFSQVAIAKFNNESELSSIKTGGNTDVLTLNSKTLNTYQWSRSRFGFGGHYTYAESKNKGGVTARNWDVNTRYEHSLTDRFSLVVGEIVEGNKFIGIKERYNSDFGARFYYIKTDSKTLLSEVAYRYTIEKRYEPAQNSYDHKARLYNEFSHKFSETVQYKFWLEYIPNFTVKKDYLINGEASLTTIITSIFSLKVAYMGMYDNKPATTNIKNYDYATTTSLVVKF